MSDTRFDILVLGAGMVGTATAAHLAMRGLKTALVDREGPAAGTSYGNAGVIDPAAFLPHAFPRHLPTLLKYASGATPHMRFDPMYLPRIAGWMWSYFRESAPDRILAAAQRLAPLTAHAVSEHKALAAAAGVSALIRDTGWMQLYRTETAFRADAGDRDLLARFGMSFDVQESAGIAAIEPHLKPIIAKAVFMPGASSTSDPGQLTQAYADLMVARGGTFVKADAKGLMRRAEGFVLATPDGSIAADQVVVALGPWANDLLKGFGFEVPIVAKRGYHMHFAAEGNATLSRPIIDMEVGYCLTPMTKGIRLTTGAEFADRDARANPVQIDRCEDAAHQLFPLQRRVEPEPWLGKRPNTPDGVPIIGRAPGVPGMWLAVGHGHWGLCLGPATGRLIADMVTGATPFVDPEPLGYGRLL